MLIARPSDDGFTVIDGFSRIVRLGEGLVRAGTLHEAARERAAAALQICRERIDHHGAVRVRCVATAACRQADNGDAFVDQIHDATGLHLETITPDEEAGLTVSGCAPLLASGHPRGILFDIGGGSTEVMWLDTSGRSRPAVLDMVSLPLGVVTLVDEFGRGGLEPRHFDSIVQRVDERLEPFSARNAMDAALAANTVQMIGTSGTMTTMGAMHLDLERYDRARIDGLSMDLSHIRAMAARLSEMDFASRQALPCIGRSRADLMVMGCAVLTAIIRRWPVPVVKIADRGIREGLIMRMIADDLDTGAAAPAA